MRTFIAFTKTAKNADGSIEVEGIASSEAVDSDGEIILADAMKAALPDFFIGDSGPMREMHQPMAAGKITAAEINDAGQTIVRGIVIDPTACLKVETEVYRGFSIGGRVTKRDPANRKIITGLSLNEISLVDRPANPEALLTMWKADMTTNTEAAVVQPQLQIDPPLASAADADAAAKAAAPAGAAVEPTPEPQIEGPVVKADTVLLVKGMYSIGWLTNLLLDLACLADEAAYERAFEQDASTVPEELKAVARRLGEILQSMVAEETAELLGPGDGDAIAAAAANADLGTIEPAPAPELAPSADDAATKLGGAGDDQIAKALNDAQTLLKSQGEQLAKALKDIEALKALPAAPKGSVRAVSKAEDSGAAGDKDGLSDDDIMKAFNAMDPQKRALVLMKAAQLRPIEISRP